MNSEKYYLVLDEEEQGIMLNALNSLRNNFLSQDKHSEELDALMLKIATAPVKKTRMWREYSEAR